MKQFPRYLKRDEGFSCACRHREQDARLLSGDSLHHTLNGQVLIVASLEVAALVFEGHGSKAVAPGVGFGEGPIPELFRRRILFHDAFLAFGHVDAINFAAVGGIAITDGELIGVVLRLRHAFGQRFVPGLGFDDGEFVVAIDEHVIGSQRLAAPSKPFDSSERDGIFTQDAAALDHGPACGLQGGVNVLGSGFGFVQST